MRKIFIAGLVFYAACGAAVSAPAGPSAMARYRSEPVVQFPSREEFQRLVAAAPSAVTADAEAPPVFTEAWTLTGPFDDAAPLAPIEPATPLDRIAIEAARGITPSPATTAAMRCTAREMARFLLVHPSSDERVLRLAAGRCGSTTGTPMIESTVATFDGRGVNDDALMARFADDLRRRASESFGHLARLGADQVGASWARDRGRAVFAFVGAREALALEPRAPVVTEAVVLRGHLADPATSVAAIATYGRNDFVRCEVMGAPPEIALRCPMHPEDRVAWVDVLAQTPGRILADRIARAMLRRDEGVYLEPLAIDAALAAQTDAAGVDRALLDHANTLRAAMGRAPLALEPRESATVQQVMPAFFAAHAGQDSRTLDTLTLGVIAGWDVAGGTIRDAHLGISMHALTRNPGEWLALMMDQPMTRAVLLDPDVSAAAIAARIDDERTAFTGLVVSYAFFDREDAVRPLQRVQEALIAARRAAGRPPPIWVRDPALLAAAESVREGRAGPGVALDRAMSTAVANSGRSVRAQLLETLVPSALPWPAELIEANRIALAVTWHRVRGAAWGQYVIFALLYD